MTYPLTPGFKGEADTGRNAARAAARAAPDRRTEALNALAVLGEATAEQIVARTGRHWYKTRPRLSEAKALGQVQDTGKRALTGMGGKTIVWRLSTPEELAQHHARKAADAAHGEASR